MRDPQINLDELGNSIEVLVNLVYLTKNAAGSKAIVLTYMDMAEQQLTRLIEAARLLN